jgi:F-type H+-transporting ATPase subunit b
MAFSYASRTLQEIAELEHKNFALEQENAIKTELKQVLDSWVRYEQQQRESEQLDLVKTVKAGVEAELAKPAFKKQLLEEALAHVESECTGRT